MRAVRDATLSAMFPSLTSLGRSLGKVPHLAKRAASLGPPAVGAAVASEGGPGRGRQQENADLQCFLKFSFMKAYTMGLLNELKKPTAWTMAMTMLRVTSS